jgi:hypothetical protein
VEGMARGGILGTISLSASSRARDWAGTDGFEGIVLHDLDSTS